MMARSQNQVATVQELVDRFLSTGLAQYDAAYVVDTRKYNRLYAIMVDIEKALESVRDSGVFPQCADAAGMLSALDEGFYVPN
jgi:hypothetical protein